MSRSDHAAFCKLQWALCRGHPADLSPADQAILKARALAIFQHAAASEDGVAPADTWSSNTWVPGSLVELMLQLVEEVIDWEVVATWPGQQQVAVMQLVFGWVDWGMLASGEATSVLGADFTADGQVLVHGWAGPIFAHEELISEQKQAAAEAAAARGKYAAGTKAAAVAVARWEQKLGQNKGMEMMAPGATTVLVGPGRLPPIKHGVLVQTHLHHLLDLSRARPAMHSALCSDPSDGKHLAMTVAVMLAMQAISCCPHGLMRWVAAGGGAGVAASAAEGEAAGVAAAAAAAVAGAQAGEKGVAAAAGGGDGSEGAAVKMTREEFMQRFADALRTRPPAFLGKTAADAVEELRNAAAAAAGGLPAPTGGSSLGPALQFKRMTAADPAGTQQSDMKRQRKGKAV
jgi:hypothetical protein